MYTHVQLKSEFLFRSEGGSIVEQGRKAAVLLLIIAISASLLLSGCFHTHEWAEATCTEPRRCIGCEETEGEPLGHD